MRTKHLLLALAVPALFAACQQDDFTTDGVKTDALQGRKSIGEVTFVVDNGADTRWTQEGAFNEIVPELGDAMSVNLVDIPAQSCSSNPCGPLSHDYAIDNYQLVNYVNSNYKFERNAAGTGWELNGNLVEGNYVITAPFTKTQSREPIVATLPVRQQVDFKEGSTTEIDPTSPLKNVLKEGSTPMLVAYRFLEAQEEITGKRNVGLQFSSIYAYPLIRVANTNMTYAQDMVLEQVVIENPNRFQLKTKLSSEGIRNAMINEVFAPKGTDNVDQAILGSWIAEGTKGTGAGGAGDLGYADGTKTYPGANYWKKDVPFYVNDEGKTTTSYIDVTRYANGTWTAIKGKKGAKNMPWTGGVAYKTAIPATKDLLMANAYDAPTEYTNYIVIDMPEGGVTIPYDEYIEFNAIVPAAVYNNTTGQELKIWAKFKNTTWKKTLNTNTTVTTLPGKQYPREDYKMPEVSTEAQGPALKGTKGGYFNVYTNTTNTQDYGTYAEVKNVKVAVVKTQDELVDAVSNAASDGDWTIVVEGKNLVWDETVNAQVSASNTNAISVEGHITIAGGEELNDWMTISDYVSFEDADVRGWVSIQGTHTAIHDITVDQGAYLYLGSRYDKLTRVVNLGTLMLADEAATVDNYGRLIIYCSRTDNKITNRTGHCYDLNYYTKHTEAIISNTVNLVPTVEVANGYIYTISKDINYYLYLYDNATLDVNTYVNLLGYMADACGGYNKDVYGYLVVPEKGKLSGSGKIYVDSYLKDCVEIAPKAQGSGYEVVVVVEGDVNYNDKGEKTVYYTECGISTDEYDNGHLSYKVAETGILTIGTADDPIVIDKWGAAPTLTTNKVIGEGTIYAWFAAKTSASNSYFFIMSGTAKEVNMNRCNGAKDSMICLPNAVTVEFAKDVDEALMRGYPAEVTLTVEGQESTLTIAGDAEGTKLTKDDKGGWSVEK